MVNTESEIRFQCVMDVMEEAKYILALPNHNISVSQASQIFENSRIWL